MHISAHPGRGALLYAWLFRTIGYSRGGSATKRVDISFSRAGKLSRSTASARVTRRRRCWRRAGLTDAAVAGVESPNQDYV